MIVLLVYLASQTFLRRSEDAGKATYSQLISTVETAPGSIQEVVFSPKGRSIEADLANGQKWKVNYPSDEAQSRFQELLQTKGVEFDSKGSGASGWGFLLSLLPLVLFLSLIHI